MRVRSVAGPLADRGRRGAARPGVHEPADQRAAVDAAWRRRHGPGREHLRADEQVAEHALRVEAGPYVRVVDRRPGHRHSEGAPAADLRSVLQHQAARQRARPRHDLLDRQEPRRTRSASSRSSGRGTTMEVHFPAASAIDRRARRRAPRVVPSEQRPAARARDGRRSVGQDAGGEHARVPRLRRRDRRQRQRRRRALQARASAASARSTP